MFTTKSKSGASCLSRCLIYKVHTALSGGSLSYHTVFILSRTFFRFFNLLFSQTPRRATPYLLAASAGDSLIVSLLFRSVKNFFQEFFSLFCSLIQNPYSEVCRPLSDSFDMLPRLFSIVKHFFRFFSFFFMSLSIQVSVQGFFLRFLSCTTTAVMIPSF